MHARRRLIIHCASSHISGGWFQRDTGGQLVLDRYFTRDLDYDLSREARWLPAVVSALRELAREHPITGEAAAIVPGNRLLTKFLTVPVVEGDGQGRTIAYEVQQNLPYELSDVVWDAQELSNDGVELEVVVVAVKSEEVENFCRIAPEANLQVENVGAGSVLDLNTFRAAVGDSAGETLLLNVGARSTNISLIGGSKFFTRNVPLGGNTVTAGLANDLDVSFQEAEEFKIRAFSMDKIGPALPDRVQALAESSGHAFMRRLGVEINRTIANFRRQGKGDAPQKAFLAGGGSKMPGLSDFLNTKLKMRVEFLEPERALAPSSSVHDGGANTLLRDSELIGQAHALTASDLTGCVDIDLLPARLKEEAAFARRKPALIATGSLLAAVGLIILLHLRGVVEANRALLEEIGKELRPAQVIQSEMDVLLGQTALLRTRYDRLDAISRSKANWVRFLADMQGRLAAVEDVWLEELSLLPPNQDSEKEAGNVSDQADDNAADSLLPSARTEIRLLLVGRMLDRENPLARVSPNVQRRVNQLISSFADSAFIASVEDRKFDTTENGLLRFQFTVLVDGKNPL